MCCLTLPVQIYGQRVVDASALGEIKPVELVVLTPLTIDASFQDLFARLVPLTTHLAASEHSSTVDSMVRQVNQSLDEQVGP